MLRFRPLLLGLTFLAFGWISAQESPPLDSGITEKVRVELVQLNLLALYKDGQPVTDLRPEDLELKDGGKEQKIAFLERFSSHATVSEVFAPQSVNTPPAARVDATEKKPPLKTRWIVLVFDNCLTSLRTRAKAVEAARTFLETEVKEQDRVSIVNFTGKLEVLQPFTSDRGKLLEACVVAGDRRKQTVEDREGAIDDLIRRVTECRGKTDPSLCVSRYLEAFKSENRRQADIYLTGLTSLVRSLAPIPETKALVIISEGFPRESSQEGMDVVQTVFSSREAQGMLLPGGVGFEDRGFDLLAQAAGEARVTIFPIYPGGTLRSGSTDARRSGPLDQIKNPLQLDVFARSEKNLMMGLADMAKRTGGELIRTADPVEGLRRVNAEAEGIYTLGFYPRAGNTSARFHEIKLKAKRKGIQIQYAKELIQPSLRPALPGTMTLTGDGCEANRRKVAMKLKIPRRSLTFERVKSGYSANFSLYLAVLLDGNQDPGFFDYRVFNLSVPEDAVDVGKGEDPGVEQTFVVPCQGLTLKAIVSDLASGAKGSFSEYLPEAK